MDLLLVEDDELVRAVLVEVLSDAGWDVIEAGCPAEAFAWLSHTSASPEMLVTDVDLGADLDGFALAAEIRRRCPAIRVVFISGLPDHFDSRVTDGSDRFLAKPFRGQDLIGAIRSLMGGLRRWPSTPMPLAPQPGAT